MLQTLKQTTRNTLHTRNILSISVLQKRHATDSERMREYMKARAKERNTITINTKTPRPVFVERENPDTPPAITLGVIELARLLRTTNSLAEHFYNPELEISILASYNDAPVYTKRLGKCPENTADTPRPLWICIAAKADEKRFRKAYTVYNNIQPEDKPAFRHDSLFLFDSLSEVYSE